MSNKESNQNFDFPYKANKIQPLKKQLFHEKCHYVIIVCKYSQGVPQKAASCVHFLKIEFD